MHDLLLTEILWKGDYYTWSNIQLGPNRIFRRLDRAMGNDEWMLNYGQLVLDYRLSSISDHSHIVLNMCIKPSSIRNSFRFLSGQVMRLLFLW